MGGFKDLHSSNELSWLTIRKSDNPEELPQGQKFINQLDLPPYPNYETLEAKLILVLE